MNSDTSVLPRVRFLRQIHQGYTTVVTGAAVKLTLSMLSLMIDPKAKASKFINGALNAGTNYLLMGMEPDYWIFKDVFAETKAQYAWQSLWLRASKSI